MRPDDLLCSPNAHARSIVFLDRRCSSKRALGGQSVLPLRKMGKLKKYARPSAQWEINQPSPQERMRTIWKRGARCGKGRVSARPGWEGEIERARLRLIRPPLKRSKCESQDAAGTW